VSIEPAVPLINPFECLDAVYFWFSPKFPMRCDRFLSVMEHSWWKLSDLWIQFLVFQVRCIVKFVGINRPAGLFVVFCCEGLLAFFSCLVAVVDLLHKCPLQFRCSVLWFHIYNKVQIRVSLSKLFFVFFLPLIVWRTILMKKYMAFK